MAAKTQIAPKKNPERLISAAFDIGTTYSGYAYSTLHDKRKIITNQTWISGGRSLVSLKAPTCVLLKPNKTFHSFGYEAEDHYASLTEDDNHHDWLYFRRFKMMLHNDKELSLETTVEDILGRSMPAVDIFAMLILYLKDHMLKTLNNQLSGVILRDITFSLTVPAIWNDRAKQFMREAATKAGISNEQLIIALEPEAASVWCQSIQTEISRDEDGARADISVPGTQCMIVDIGGGTADITVHEKQPNNTLKEIHTASGGPWGGIEVDKAFLQFLTNIVSEEVMEKFKTEQMFDYIDIFREFEIKKRKLSHSTEGKILIKIPASLKETFEKCGHTLSDVKKMYGEKVDWKGDKMRIAADILKQTIDVPVRSLVSHIRGIFAEKKMFDVKQIILVGGFAESPYVQEKFKECFQNRKIIVPAECGLVVLKGAVVYGHNPEVLSERLARYTYGLDIVVDFNPKMHPAENRVETNTGTVCKNVFWTAVKVGQPLPLGYTVSRVGRPANDYTDHISCYICKSTRVNPFLTTEEHCEDIGYVRMEMDDTKTSLENTYDEIFYFGDTEIKFFMKHHLSGEEAAVYLDF